MLTYLNFECNYVKIFPQLLQLARQVLIIPVSNTCIERVFSVSGVTIIEKRTKLAIRKIDKMMFLNRNSVHLKCLYQTNGNGLPHDTFHPLFHSNKRVSLSDLLSSSSAAKRRRLSIEDEAMSSEQYAQTHSANDYDDADKDIF